MRITIQLLLIAGILVMDAGTSLCQPESIEKRLDISITYVGNEGILIEGGNKKVLIDGLHREYKPAYLHLSDQQISEAEQGKPPFDDIDLLLVTHIHRDHFHSGSVGRYLRNNPGAVAVGSQQVTDSLKAQFEDYPEIASRVRSVTPAPGTAESIIVDGVEVEILRMAHTNQRFDWVQNLGFLIIINGDKVLHIGDAAMSAGNFTSFHLNEKTIDVACLPFWFFIYQSGRQLIRDQIQADHLLAVHVDPRKTEEYTNRIKKAFPDAVPFIKLFTVFPDSFSNQ